MDEGVRRRSIRGWRRLGLALLALALLSAAALWLAWSARLGVAERVLLEQLALRGVDPAALRVTRFDVRGMEVADVVLGAPDAPDLTVARLEAEWTLEGLRDRYLEALHLSGLHL